jgi:hypothetical protein
MWLLKNDVLEDSGVYNMNFLFNQEKFYIMDNHLAAAWCWMQKTNANEQYGFFHIDRHYDLLNNLSTDFIERNRELLTGSLSDYLNIKLDPKDKYPAVRFDNYIDLYRKLNPQMLTKYYFATHEDGSYLDEIDSYMPKIWEMQDNISYWIGLNEAGKWIINIDLDYFFQEKDSNVFQLLTDEYVKFICEEIEREISKIEVITIALSPSFCGGWKSAFRVLKLITDYFNLEFNPDWDIQE